MLGVKRLEDKIAWHTEAVYKAHKELEGLLNGAS